MKILNISSFEKLDINPININMLDSIGIWFKHIDPKSIRFEDMEPGYLIKIAHSWNTYGKDKVYMMFTKKQLSKITDISIYTYLKSELIFIYPEFHKTNLICYNNSIHYKEKWPKFSGDHAFDIVDVWISNLDITEFKSIENIHNFFDKYNLYEIHEDLENLII